MASEYYLWAHQSHTVLEIQYNMQDHFLCNNHKKSLNSHPGPRNSLSVNNKHRSLSSRKVSLLRRTVRRNTKYSNTPLLFLSSTQWDNTHDPTVLTAGRWEKEQSKTTCYERHTGHVLSLPPLPPARHALKTEAPTLEQQAQLLQHIFLTFRYCFCNPVQKASKCKVYLLFPLAYSFNFFLKRKSKTHSLTQKAGGWRHRVWQAILYHKYYSRKGRSQRPSFHESWIFCWYSSSTSPTKARS